MVLKIPESPLDNKPVNLKGNQYFLYYIIFPEYSLEGLMLKVKLQYCGHLMRIADSLEKSLMLRKIEGRKSRGIRG